jgi:hypothetical protein
MAPLDDYERSAMSDGAAVRFHDKGVHGLGVPIAVGLGGVLLSSMFFVPTPFVAPQGRIGAAIVFGGVGALLAAGVALLGVLAGVKRVIVTGRALRLQIGVTRRAIPLGSIRAVERSGRTAHGALGGRPGGAAGVEKGHSLRLLGGRRGHRAIPVPTVRCVASASTLDEATALGRHCRAWPI